MNTTFFLQQEQARQRTRLLIVLFVLALVAIVLAVNGAMAVIWSFARDSYFARNGYPEGFFLTNTAVTLGLLLGGTALELYRLRDGGDAVARMAGGRLVAPSTTDLHERRLLNVVEEMALAASIACPSVYLLEHEESINAFAAGYHQNQAVVAVTRGALLRLTRDELQGVVAHEFSHILNGDMRLNMRLIAILFGMQMVAGFGRHLMRWSANTSSHRDRERGGPLILLAVGAALYVIGYIGVLFGRLIKAAVARQREFLADASAVQFTRNVDGIGGALRKIGGLARAEAKSARIHNPNAEHLSHFFLGAPNGIATAGWLATHPPLAERLRRLYGRFMGFVEAPWLATAPPSAAVLPDIPFVPVRPEAVMPAAPAFTAPDEAAGPTPQPIRLPVAIETALRRPEDASLLVLALLLQDGVPCPEQHILLEAELAQRSASVLFLGRAIANLEQRCRLPLLDLATPALRQLDAQQRTRLLTLVSRLIVADRRMTLMEFAVQSLLQRRLGPRAGRPVPVSHQRLDELRAPCVLLLSLVAWTATRTGAAAPETFARGCAALQELKLTPDELLPAAQVSFPRVHAALAEVDRLAPLRKPALVKAWFAACGAREPLPVELRDLLHALCAAIDAPLPFNEFAMLAA